MNDEVNYAKQGYKTVFVAQSDFEISRRLLFILGCTKTYATTSFAFGRKGLEVREGLENRLVGKIYRSLNVRAKEWPSLVSVKFFTTVHDSIDSVKTVHSYYGVDQTADFPGDAFLCP